MQPASGAPRSVTAWAAVFFLILPALAALPSTAQAANPGDWVVTGSESLVNQTRIMNGSVLIPTGATLTVRNSTLAFDLPIEGKYNITIEEGGSLFLEDSAVRSNVSGLHYNFLARGHLEVRRSDIADMRGDVGLGGLEVESGNMVMEDSYIHHNRYYGLFLKAGSPVVRRTTFESNVVAISVLPGATPTLEDLVIRNSTGFGVKVSNAAPLLRNVTIVNSTNFGIGVVGGTLSVDGCRIVGGTVGIDAAAGAVGTVAGCDILNVGTGVRAVDANLTVANGSFFSNGVGINATGSPIEILGNRFTDTAVGVRATGPVDATVGGEALGNAFDGTGTAFEVYLSSFFLQGNTYGPLIRSLRVFHTITLLVVDKAGVPVQLARVNFTAQGGVLAFTGVTNETGMAVATVEQYQEFSNGTRLNLTPHAVTITHNGQVTETTINATEDRAIQVTLSEPGPADTSLGGVPRDALVIFGIVVGAIALLSWAASRSRGRRRSEDNPERHRPARRRGPRSGR